MSKLLAIFFVAVLLISGNKSSAQMERYAVTNVSLNIGLSESRDQQPPYYSYYLLSLTASPNSDTNKLTVIGSGSRYDVLDQVAPEPAVEVQVNSDVSVIQGPVQTHTTESTFVRKVGKSRLTLTNQTVAEVAFVSIELSDGGFIKGPFVYTYTRTQTPTKRGIVWRTNETWYGGQLFATYMGRSGSVFLGE
jgi:hypothetical protein